MLLDPWGKPARAALSPRLLSSAMSRLGGEEGRNLTMDWRFADGRTEQLPKLAAELVRLNEIE